MRKMGQALAALVLAVTATISGATMAYASVDDDPTSSSSFEQLMLDFARVRSVPQDQYFQFKAENRDWIDEVGVRLDDFLSGIPEYEHDAIILTLMGGNRLQRRDSVDDYFHSHQYHYRNGYWTYSVDPKLGVRLWRPTMEAGWSALAGIYYGIANDNGSLWRQYLCHWDYDAFGVIAGIWDLEVGRPIVSDWDMLVSMCNPT